MDTDFRLFPDSASSIAPSVDRLYLFAVWMSLLLVVLIAGTIIYFAIKYRRGRTVGQIEQPKTRYWILEVTWAVIPLIVVMVLFFWGASVFFESRRIPEDAMTIDVVGKQWMWKLQHPEGRWEINELHVPIGQPIRLRMISQDVIHSFFVPAFRMKQDVLPGRYTETWFEATRTGRYRLYCTEYCGTEHSGMVGWIEVMEPARYADWLRGVSSEPPVSAGARLFEEHRCNTCHPPHAQIPRCPSVAGLYGRAVLLRDGRTVEADDDYIRRSILDPAVEIVAGFESIMPSYRGQLSEEEILQLIAYIRSLAGEMNTTSAPDEESPAPVENTSRSTP